MTDSESLRKLSLNPLLRVSLNEHYPSGWFSWVVFFLRTPRVNAKGMDATLYHHYKMTWAEMRKNGR